MSDMNDAELAFTKHGGFKHYRRVLNLENGRVPSPRTICGQHACTLEARAGLWQRLLPHAPECTHCLVKMTLQDFLIIARKEEARVNRGN
jgi:hypothetical protein